MVATSLLSWPLSIMVQIFFPILSSRRSVSPAAERIAKRGKTFIYLFKINPVFRSDPLQNSSLHPNYMLGTACPQTLFSPPVLLFLRVDRSGSGGGYRLVVTLLN